jgi:rhamnogalacturonan endolyase
MRKLLLFSVLVNFTMLIKAQDLHRSVVAVPGNDGGIFISWRLLNADPEGGLYNVFRKNEDGSLVKLNKEPIAGKTNFMDNTADPLKKNKYYVEAVASRTESSLSTPAIVRSENDYAVAAVPAIPFFTVNLRDGVEIHFCWVGDLDGDGVNDYVIDRLNWGVGCKIEAYKSDGTFLWDVDYGPNSANMDNISPGSATIDVGHWDGVTVADITGDGRAEVITKIANGVRLGNGEVWTHADNNRQWIAVLDGPTGARIRYAALPTDYISVGPVACQFGVGNGNEIFVHAKNRNTNGSFNVINVVYRMGASLTQKWKRTGGLAEAHQYRIVDVNEDGVDDMAHIGYVLNGVDGTVLYTLPGIIHGDRFHIGKFDPNRPGLQGYGVQQVNPNGTLEYYYDARNGQILWTHTGTPSDVGRGNAADIDPARPGYEVWSFSGIYHAPTNTKLTDDPARPWPNLRLWWDGDDGSELFDNGKIEAWNPATNSVQRLLTCSDYEGATGSYRGAPLFYGDIMGDWREEVIMRNPANNRLVIFTTNIPTNISRPPLTQDRYYRNDLTVKGYMQSHHTSYYLGEGGSNPNPGTGVTLQENQTGFCGVDGTVDNDRNGYTGNGFANTNNATSAGVNWKVSIGNSSSYTVTWRYANGTGGDRPGRLLVNGSAVVSTISFPSTGGWTNWSTVSVTVPLSSAATDLRLESTQSGGLGNIDYIQLSSGAAAGNCNTSAQTAALSADAVENVYPNPSEKSFTIKNTGKFTYVIRDDTGTVVERGPGEEEVQAGSKLKPGVYIVTIQTGGNSKQVRIVKK